MLNNQEAAHSSLRNSGGVIHGRLIHDCRDILSLVSSSGRYGEYVILNTARRKVIENSMIRHIQHTVVVLHWCCSVQDRFAQEAWQTRRCWQFLDGSRGILIGSRVFSLIEIKEILRDV